MRNSNDTNGNRTRDRPACSAVPQPTPISDQNIHYFVVKDIPDVLIQQVNIISLLPIECFVSVGIREPVQMDHKNEVSSAIKCSVYTHRSDSIPLAI